MALPAKISLQNSGNGKGRQGGCQLEHGQAKWHRLAL
jgi:hypothetical protein